MDQESCGHTDQQGETKHRGGLTDLEAVPQPEEDSGDIGYDDYAADVFITRSAIVLGVVAATYRAKIRRSPYE